MLRSPFSGVAHDIACAYVTVSRREGSLLKAIGGERFAAGAEEREKLIHFTAALRELEHAPADLRTDELERLIAQRLPLILESASPPAAPTNGPFELAEPFERESAAGVRTNNPRFSASQLNSYAECPRKWFYRYLCAAVEDKGSSASYYGTAFHAALEAFHAEFPEPGTVDPKELDRKLLGYLNAAFDRHRSSFETAVEYELQVRRARRTARKYVEWLTAQAARQPFTVLGCELSAEIRLEGFDFVGYIDRLDRDDATGCVAVIDYKTGSIAQSAAEYREKVRQFKDFQLPFYYWARTLQGDRVSRLALVPLKDALLDVRPITLEVVPMSSDAIRSSSAAGIIPVIELERARERMIQLCRELTSGRSTAFEVTADPQACTYCAYALSCANRPYPLESRFAR